MNRQGYISQLEALTDSDVYIIFTAYRKGIESMLDPDMSDIIARMLHSRIQKRSKATLIVETYGGAIIASLSIINYLKKYYEKTVGIVCKHCYSAGSILMLGCDEIYMGSFAELTPIDGQHSSDPGEYESVIPMVKLFNSTEHSENDISFASNNFDRYLHYLQISALSEEFLLPLLKKHCLKDCDSKKIEDVFINGQLGVHIVPLSFEYLKNIGLDVQPLPPPQEEIVNKLIFSMEDEAEIFKAISPRNQYIASSSSNTPILKERKAKIAFIETLNNSYYCYIIPQYYRDSEGNLIAATPEEGWTHKRINK